MAKNFCKAFLAYLKSGQASREVLDEFQELGKKYNNCTIKRIIAHQNLGPLFRSFLKDRANDWVDESKIQDKHSHHEAIQIYQGLYGNQPDECLQSNLSSQMDASMEFDSQHFSREEPLDQSE